MSLSFGISNGKGTFLKYNLSICFLGMIQGSENDVRIKKNKVNKNNTKLNMGMIGVTLISNLIFIY
jgi:hypothetical protein